MVGVHCRDLTHLIMMPVTPISMGLFYPTGFDHSYEWPARALGMKHLSIWNDTYVPTPTTRAHSSVHQRRHPALSETLLVHRGHVR